MSFVVAIDGPAGAGKGTITKLVGEKLNLVNVDTGATFRCVALNMLKENVGIDEEEKIKALLEKINIEMYAYLIKYIFFKIGEILLKN